MCLRFVFLLITRLAAWLRLSRREETWKTAEILLLRHQLAVLQRRELCRPKLTWADRALLATVLSVIPESASPGAAAAGHPGHDPALAPRHRPQPLGRQVHARQGRPPSDPAEHQGPCPPAGPGEPRMGLPQDPRRAGRPGSEGSAVDGLGDPEKRRNRARTAADWAYLVPVPALTSRSGHGGRLLHSRPARRHPGLCPGRDRTRDPTHPHPGSHLASDRGMDRPAGP
jgi:hypothetical protein